MYPSLAITIGHTMVVCLFYVHLRKAIMGRFFFCLLPISVSLFLSDSLSCLSVSLSYANSLQFLSFLNIIQNMQNNIRTLSAPFISVSPNTPSPSLSSHVAVHAGPVSLSPRRRLFPLLSTSHFGGKSNTRDRRERPRRLNGSWWEVGEVCVSGGGGAEGSD